MKLADRRLLELLDRRSLSELGLAGKKVLVAISGGADSVALLRALFLYSGPVSFQLKAVHVNHGIRAESADEENFVIKLCQSLNIDLRVHHLRLGNKPQRTSPEQFWREKRYEAFQLSMTDFKADYLSLGHTADDLAETFLYHLVRGTSPDGLAFYFLSRTETAAFPIFRPLWKARRGDIEEALAGVNQEWVNDPSNLEIRFSRNRIRKEIIPALEKINPEAVTAIVSFADKLSSYCSERDSGPDTQLLQLDITPSLRSMPYKEICQTVHQFLSSNGKLSHATRHVEQAADMIRNNTSGLVALPNSKTIVLTQTTGWLYYGAEPKELDLAREHCIRFQQFAADLSGQEKGSDPDREIRGLDGQTYCVSAVPQDHMQIRNRQPGDRVGPRSLKKLLIDFHVPWYLRDYLVLAATTDGQVVDLLTDDQPLRAWIKKHSATTVSLSSSKITTSA